MNSHVEEDRYFIDANGEKFLCFSPRAMKQMYPEGGYRLLGEIIKEQEDEECEVCIDKDGRALSPAPLGTYKKPVYRPYGYIRSEEENGFILVKKSQKVLLALLAILTILIALGIIWSAAHKLSGPDIDKASQAFSSKIKRPEELDESKTLIPGYDVFKMYEETDEIYVALLNPKDNPCYFQYDIILDETEEVLFSTKLIPPGEAVTKIQLPRKLKKGEYPITVRINSYSLDDPEQRLNGGESKTRIVVYEKTAK